MLEANVDSFENMRQNLEANEIDPEEIPLVFQFNKRDLPNALPIEILNERLNPHSAPFFEAVAVKGIGVEETLKGVTGLVFRALAAKYGGPESVVAAASSGAPATAPAARATIGPRAVPDPPARMPEPPRAPVAAEPSHPALNLDSPDPTADELLDALELQPASDIDELMPEPADLLSPLDHPSAEEEIETLDVDEVLAPPPPPKSAVGGPRITLVSGPKEAEALRQRIAAPADVTELSLEELDEDEEDEPIEDLAFELQPPVPPSPAPAPTVSVERSQTLPPGARPTARQESAPPAPAAASTPSVATVPVTVEVSAASGQTDVSIPVEVTVGSGTTQVQIHLRLSLNLKLPQ